MIEIRCSATAAECAKGFHSLLFVFVPWRQDSNLQPSVPKNQQRRFRISL